MGAAILAWLKKARLLTTSELLLDNA